MSARARAGRARWGPVLLLVALVAALLAPARGEAAAAGAGADVGHRPAGRSVLAVGSYNIRGSLPLDAFGRAVDGFRGSVDVAGLQEVRSAAKRRHLAAMPGWSSFWSPQVPQTAVIWRTARFRLVAGRGDRIARLGDRPPPHAHATTVRHGLFVTVVRLRERGNGHRLSLVDVHLVAGAVADGRCVPGQARLCRLFRESVRGLRGVAVGENRWAHGRVFLAGDFNDDYRTDRLRHDRRFVYGRLTAIGLVAQWERAGSLPPGGGSYPSRGTYLDQVWAPVLPRSADVERGLDLSDHYPVRAVYGAR